MSRVPVGRRNLFSDRRRAILGIAGVAAALLLALSLDGIFAGAMRGVTRYIDTSPADVFVAQRGVRNMHMTASSVPLAALDDIRSIRGVRWADPIGYASDSLEAGNQRQLAYVIGYEPGRYGGPTSLIEGAPPDVGEIVLDGEAAGILEVDVGDEVEVLGRPWRVSGLSPPLTSIVNSIAFVRFDELAAARGLASTAGYFVVGTAPGAAERTVIGDIEAATGLTALTQERFSKEEAQAIRDMSTELIAIMRLAAFVIALAVVGLTLYAATISRIREVGVMKALGATPGRVASTVLEQAAWSVGSGAVVAVAASFALSWILGTVGAVPMAVEAAAVVRIAASAFVLGLIGAAVPMVSVARVDPASVYRG